MIWTHELARLETHSVNLGAGPATACLPFGAKTVPSSAVSLLLFKRAPHFSKVIMLVSEKPVGPRWSAKTPLGFCATAPFEDASFELDGALGFALRFLEVCWVAAELAVDGGSAAVPAWVSGGCSLAELAGFPPSLLGRGLRAGAADGRGGPSFEAGGTVPLPLTGRNFVRSPLAFFSGSVST